MNKITIFGLAALGLAGMVSPAAADWNRLGTVDFGPRFENEREWTRFSGPMEQLRFAAERNNAQCRAIVVRFGNGGTRTVFSGMLREDRPVTINLPGEQRNVRDINFRCRSQGRGDSTIAISGDVRREPAMVALGSARFTFRPDRETINVVRRLPPIESISLRANGDAQCMRVLASFNNGRTRALDIGRGVVFEGRPLRIDLPGDARRIDSLTLTCRSTHGTNVTIAVSARPDDLRADRGFPGPRGRGYP